MAALGRGLKSTRDLYLLQHDPDVVRARLFDWAPQMDATWQIALFGALWIAAAVALIAGHRARLGAAVIVAAALFQQVVDHTFAAFHMDYMVVVLLLTAVSDSDADLSVRWLRAGRLANVTVVAWPMWLQQLQLSIVYFYTAVAKLNDAYLTGQLLRDRLALPAFLHDPSVLQWFAGGTVALEFFLVVALWSRRLRPFGFASGIALHVLVPILMGPYVGLLAFSLLTLSVYLLFVDDATIDRVIDVVVSRLHLRLVR